MLRKNLGVFFLLYHLLNHHCHFAINLNHKIWWYKLFLSSQSSSDKGIQTIVCFSYYSSHRQFINFRRAAPISLHFSISIFIGAFLTPLNAVVASRSSKIATFSDSDQTFFVELWMVISQPNCRNWKCLLFIIIDFLQDYFIGSDVNPIFCGILELIVFFSLNVR